MQKVAGGWRKMKININKAQGQVLVALRENSFKFNSLKKI